MITKSKLFILEFIFGPNTRLTCPENNLPPLITLECAGLMENLTKGEIPAVRVLPIETCLLLPSECLSDDDLANLAENA